MTSLGANSIKDDDSRTGPLLWEEITSFATTNDKALKAEFFPRLIGNTALNFPVIEKELLCGKWNSLAYSPKNPAQCGGLRSKCIREPVVVGVPGSD